MLPKKAVFLSKRKKRRQKIKNKEITPVKTEKSRPAKRGLFGKSFRKGMVAQVCSGCLPSVKEIKRIEASCQAIFAQLIYIPSSVKMGNFSKLIKRVKK